MKSCSKLSNSHLLKLVDLSDEKVSVSTSHFGVSDVNHVLWQRQDFIKGQLSNLSGGRKSREQ